MLPSVPLARKMLPPPIYCPTAFKKVLVYIDCAADMLETLTVLISP